MRNKILYFALLLLFIACNQKSDFTLNGKIENATGETLYFLKNGLVTDSLIDSVKLDESGKFKFKVKRSIYPELYRLKLDQRNLLLGVDSTENITINGSATQLLDAEIIGSKSSEQIQSYRKTVLALQKQLNRTLTANGAERDSLLIQFREALDIHKKDVIGLVLSNPASIASYYSLFQQISDEFIFSPYVKEDRPFFQSVATAYTERWPEYDRSKNIYTLVIAALSDSRKANRTVDWSSVNTVERGFIDIELKNRNGYPKKLSDFEGKTILLDFSAYAVESSIHHTFALRDLYEKYSEKGLSIYQVSLDQNYNFWSQQSSNIPWTCVNDPDGSSTITYNVTEIPTLFLINKEGNIMGRYNNVSAAAKAIQAVL